MFGFMNSKCFREIFEYDCLFQYTIVIKKITPNENTGSLMYTRILKRKALGKN